MKKTVILMLALLLGCSAASAQNILGRLGERAKNAVENNIGNKIEKGVNDILDGKKKEKEAKNNEAAVQEAEEAEEAEEKTEAVDFSGVQAESDFKRGEVAFFEDDLSGEQMGEFPSKWDLIDGSADVANLKGFKCIHFEPGSRIEPLMTDQQSYIPDVFTLEFDFWMNDPKSELSNCYELEFKDGAGDDVYEIRIGESYSKLEVTCRYRSTAEDWRDSGYGKTWELKKNDWSHFALSFNKRALKIYVNDKRVINIPNCKPAARMKIHQAEWGGFNGNKNYMTNFLYAKGAMDLYAQKVTDMSAVEKAIAETGKFVTNNILFETGKATLKPESMEEIQKVADYMKKNPTARFEVQGHTDNQGSDKVNDPLSQQRAEAVVKALEEQGVDPFNLRPVGKGSHEPVADNASEEGRAKNRRVEFIKK